MKREVKPSPEAGKLGQQKTQALQVEALLDDAYPHPATELDHQDVYQLLVATVLSAQTTDARVNQVTPTLFRRWPDAQALRQARQEELEEVLRPLGMFRRRAQAVKKLGQQLTDNHQGNVPNKREELVKLAGVGRKTANVILGNWYGLQEIAVDTHVQRVTERLGWTDGGTPLQVEKQLWNLLPQAPWTRLSLQLILHGREVCHARRPECVSCVLQQLCPSAEIFLAKDVD